MDAGVARPATRTTRTRLNPRHQWIAATFAGLAKTIEARDQYTAGHADRVTAYTLVLARAMTLPAAEIDVLRRAGQLHDIGKIGVPDHVLLKPGPLDRCERAIIESHVTIGVNLLREVPFLRDVLPVIRSHHERWDGRGYPEGLAGDGIPLHARVMAVADSLDAMTSARPYREALPWEEACRRLRSDAGRQFDGAVIAAFDRAETELHAAMDRHSLS